MLKGTLMLKGNFIFKYVSRLICMAAFGIGIYCITYALLKIQHDTQKKGLGKAISDYFTHNPQWNGIIEFFGGRPQTPPAVYDSTIIVTLILGIILTVASAIVFTIALRHKR